MDYYDFDLRFPEDLYKLRSYVLPLRLDNVRPIIVDFGSYDYVAVSADALDKDCKDFEDHCRRYLYGIPPIKMGFKENKELHMIRTEKKVQILRLLQEMHLIQRLGNLRADQHIVEKIDLEKFVEMYQLDMAESLEPHVFKEFRFNLLIQLQREVRVRDQFECECYLVENRERFFNANAIIEKFYFFHNALLRRIVCVKYLRKRTESSDTEGNETEDETVEEGGDAPTSNLVGGEVVGEVVGDEESEIGDETEEERVDSPTTDLEGGHRSENRLPDILCVIQGKAVITFLDVMLDKTLRSTVALLDDRGWGKSAALGLVIAGAVVTWYSNIYVTVPSSENLKTLFDFVCKGSAELEYKEHLDCGIVKSNDPEFRKSTMRINIYKQHGQTIQYILPHEHEKLSQVKLLVVDEAAAIPLPVGKSLLGPYFFFLASTVNSYEGAGRSLSLKLLQQLEEQSQKSKSADNALSGWLFKDIELNESIRYASGNRIERWLNALLCLDVTSTIPCIRRLSQLGDCDLYYVNRDTLFSYHKSSALFLQRMMVLYVASRYKDSPNYLQLMADTPAYHLFLLLVPVDESENHLFDILCAIQVCLEYQISQESANGALREGRQPIGDQIPWKFSQHFADVSSSLSGVRIMRIATHPSTMRMGYVSAVSELLARYFEGQLTQLSEVEREDALETPQVNVTEAADEHSVTGDYPCMVLKVLKNDDVEEYNLTSFKKKMMMLKLLDLGLLVPTTKSQSASEGW